MRSFVSFLAGLLAAALLVLVLPLVWVATHVASEDGYVDFSASLIQDESFRDEVIAAAGDEVVSRVGLPSAAVTPVRQALAAASDRLVEQDGFDAAWAEAQRQSHRAVFSDPRELSPDLYASNRLVIDVAPIAQAVVDGASERLPVSVDVPGQILVPVGGNDQRQLVERIRDTPEQAVLAGILAAGLAIISVLAARRRGRAVAWLGLGAVAAALVVRLISHEVVPEIMARNTSTGPLGQRMQDLLAEHAVASMDRLGVMVMIAGGVVAIASTLVAVGTRRPAR